MGNIDNAPLLSKKEEHSTRLLYEYAIDKVAACYFVAIAVASTSVVSVMSSFKACKCKSNANIIFIYMIIYGN